MRMEKIQALLAEADNLKDELNALRSRLDNKTIVEALQIEYTYQSNRIEGNTLTLRETAMVIHEGVTIGGKTLREHLEAINHQEAILLIEDIVGKKIAFSEYILKQIHALILHGIDRENAGIYRRVPVMISGSQHIPPQPYLLQPLMEDYFIFYEENKSILHPIILAAEMHERLVTIHPFIDGNGRTSRLVMNLLLLQNGFPLAILKGDYDSRMRYYNALERVQTQEDKTVFFELIIETVISNMKNYIAVLSNK